MIDKAVLPATPDSRPDVRDLQKRSSALGLSPLARSEACILKTLQQVLTLVSRMTGKEPPHPGPASPIGCDDGEAILARNPEVCLVDEFPHTNVPGSERAKRWEDVQALLEAGISVLTTMNIQHLESLNDQICNITGVRVRETIPDWVVQQADEVVMTDVTPRALLHRLERGVVYPKEKAQQALLNFFREQTLVALRELALRQAAHEVEQRMESGGTAVEEGAGPHVISGVKILVLVTAEPETAMLIRRAKRVSDFLGAECFAVTVQPSGTLNGLPPKSRAAI